jgi:hypothetical protein
MVATSSLTDCQRFADAVLAAGGRVPKPLTNILAAADLLARSAAPSDPAGRIVEAPVAGTLTEKRLDAMLAEYATTQLASSTRGELRQRSERMFTEAFHRALADGADQLLTSLRPVFDEHAEAIAQARNLIPADQPAEQFLRSGAKPAAVTAWQQLDGHLAAINASGAVAASFGPRTGNFPLIEEYALGDGFRLEDRAIFCANGPQPGGRLGDLPRHRHPPGIPLVPGVASTEHRRRSRGTLPGVGRSGLGRNTSEPGRPVPETRRQRG